MQGSDTYGLSLGGKIIDKPTITFTPLQGQDYVEQLYQPLSLEKLSFLINSGWSISRVLRLTVQEVNGLKNAPTASGPTPELAPEFEEFRRAVGLLRELTVNGGISVARTRQGERLALALVFTETGKASTQGQELYRLLNLDFARNSFVISNEQGPEYITVVTRPLVAVLFYMSHAVAVPAKHDGRLVTTTRDRDGAPWDWKNMYQGLFSVAVRTGRRAPKAAIRIRYRDHWYYIPDDDLEAKSTFLLLQQLISLQSGEIKGSVPVLTIPVTN